MGSQYDANYNPSNTYKLWQKWSKKPFGSRIFSLGASLWAPYFVTVLPHVHEMRPGYAKVHVPKWWLVNNHIGTFHAIAACNAAEMAMGMLAEASLPSTHRWLPMGMRTQYKAKTKGALTATATAELPDFSTITRESGGQKVPVIIHFEDAEGKESVYAEIDIWVTAKK
ncbi:hotdog fold domain-containing protein [Corynebacterium heidelbergense]|uniref:Thioesterase n=1 Tax=Corynebacterium heidelbergense TaxID=2055947 RepID=A0A364VC11_9CORY|nr:hotdog fold domain-containing protein [Corynebacterium heidelbergense]RAV34148.1 thioesterase [Corynebacterium heidelbergense]WCZ37578.1 hypothetical protein CHEID_10305 [Corynebacterium heidelbergense]